MPDAAVPIRRSRLFATVLALSLAGAARADIAPDPPPDRPVDDPDVPVVPIAAGTLVALTGVLLYRRRRQ